MIFPNGNTIDCLIVQKNWKINNANHWIIIVKAKWIRTYKYQNKEINTQSIKVMNKLK